MKCYIVKNLSEELLLYKTKPSYNNKLNMWVGGGLPIGKLTGHSFPEVTFENSPKEVELKLVNN